MNIACYSHYFTPEIGAPSARIHDLSRHWIASGHSVQVVTCFPNHPVGRIYPGYKPALYMQEIMDSICVHRHRTYITPNTGFIKRTLGHISYLPASFLVSNRHLSRPDVVIGTSPTFFAAIAAALTSMERDLPFIMEVRDLWPALLVELGVLRNARMIGLLESVEMWLYRKAAKVVTVTESFRNNLIERGIDPEKIHTIPNGADPDYWRASEQPSALRRELGFENGFVVLYIGAHGISHALGRLLDVAARLKGIRDIRFLFVGEGAEKAQLIAKAQELRLENVIFHDAVDKTGVRDFYSMADVCLVPLRDIPLFNTFIPSKLFEIMAMERPIVGSVRGEAADILDRSKSAIVVPPEDCVAIADAILYLYNHKDKGAEMGQAGREFVVRHYSRGALAGSYLSVLQEAIKEHQRKMK